MKVLLVSHNFLPAHTGGTELYTLQLGQHLDRRGHDVHVFTAEKDISRSDMSLHEREFGGLPVTELVNNLHYQEFEESWDNSRVDEVFDQFLERLEPIQGSPPDLLRIPSGCAFNPRCPHAQDRCREETPLLRDLDGPGQRASSCHFTEEIFR